MLVKVVRAFHRGGKVHEVGSQAEFADHVARELIWLGKAEAASATTSAKPSGPMTTESAAAVVSGKKSGKSAGGD